MQHAHDGTDRIEFIKGRIVRLNILLRNKENTLFRFRCGLKCADRLDPTYVKMHRRAGKRGHAAQGKHRHTFRANHFIHNISHSFQEKNTKQRGLLPLQPSPRLFLFTRSEPAVRPYV